MAPSIPGYTALSQIGSGGYADVFLYEQQMPLRQVAVKVLKPSSLVGDVQRRQFTAEANSMAKVSTHPFIVSIFHADIAADGRPYLVMEYYPGDNYLKRARHEHFGVPEALRAGIQIGSAIETAHRAGILHRDIKPANVLTSEFRRPGLTDFGIAAATGVDAEEASGISIPWSPPEAFGDADLGIAADVYSLAATVYHLLAGRSPYEVPGGDNSALALISRIERGKLPSLGRPDIPLALERVLAQALSARPEQRPARVVDLLRHLQSIESAERLSVTPLELADDTAPVRQRSTSDDDDATRVNRVSQIEAQGPVAIASVPTSPTGVVPQAPRNRERMLPEPEVVDTVHRPAAGVAGNTLAHDSQRPKRGLVIGGSAAGLMAVLGVTAAFTLGGGSDGGGGATTTASFGAGEQGNAVLRPEPVQALVGTVGVGGVNFNWTVPDAESGDFYEVTATVSEGEALTSKTSSTSYFVDAPAGGRVCASIVAFRSFATPSVAVEECVDV